MSEHFPTGPATNEEELQEMLAIVQSPAFLKIKELFERTRKDAEFVLRNPQKSKPEIALYSYGYNNGCLDQIDNILKLHDLLNVQLESLKENSAKGRT